MTKIVGWRKSTWTNPENKKVYPVVRLYCLEDFFPSDDPEVRFDGVRCGVYKVAGEDVLAGVAVGDNVMLYFDKYQRVNRIDIV